MLIRVGHSISLKFDEPTAMVLMLYLHPSCADRLRKAERLQTTPQTPWTDYTDIFGNRCARLMAPAGRFLFANDAVVEDNGEPDPQVWDAAQHVVQDLPDDTLQFLLASRYCEVDSELANHAYRLFGQMRPGWSQVVEICNFVHNHVKFDYLQARPNRTALETFQEAKGVCRDYTHLAITFCRIMNIPARYCTGYLGDIGVPDAPPMDFSAWFEAYLGGRWHTFDARNNIPRIGRVLMARGRDAADVALTTTFGFNTLDTFDVWAYEISEKELIEAG
ncbi:MAG: transglutaminase family protein [Thermaerobacterales bacterium]